MTHWRLAFVSVLLLATAIAIPVVVQVDGIHERYVARPVDEPPVGAEVTAASDLPPRAAEFVALVIADRDVRVATFRASAFDRRLLTVTRVESAYELGRPQRIYSATNAAIPGYVERDGTVHETAVYGMGLNTTRPQLAASAVCLALAFLAGRRARRDGGPEKTVG